MRRISNLYHDVAPMLLTVMFVAGVFMMLMSGPVVQVGAGLVMGALFLITSTES